MFVNYLFWIKNKSEFFPVWCMVAACLVGIPAPAVAADVAPANLIIHVSGFSHERGQAMASLFREGDDIFGAPYIRVAAPILQGKATLIFSGVMPGNYAITTFHDENSNNDLDHNLLRFPAEPLGFSNNFKLSVFSGMPSFEKLRFVFAADTPPLEISVK